MPHTSLIMAGFKPAYPKIRNFDALDIRLQDQYVAHIALNGYFPHHNQLTESYSTEIPSPHLHFLTHTFIPSWVHIIFHQLSNSPILPNLTKPNLCSRAPNPAGASTHLSYKCAGFFYVFQCSVRLSEVWLGQVSLARFAGTRLPNLTNFYLT